MSIAHISGYPRIGANRELKFALEGFWLGQPGKPRDEASLRAAGRALRTRHWAEQRQAGLDMVSVGDFAWYDHVLQTACLLGALPTRFGFNAQDLTLDQLFQLARGNAAQPALAMTKWFDTNYHYLVPELSRDTPFSLGTPWLFEEVDEARALGHRVKVTLLGPLSFLRLARTADESFDLLSLLPRLLPVYADVLGRLKTSGVEWLQIEEPILASDLPPAWLDAFAPTYATLATNRPALLLGTGFGDVRHHAAIISALAIDGVHLDLARAPAQLDDWLRDWPAQRVLSAGIIDGRNVWRNDLGASLQILRRAHAQIGPRLWLSASCSLLHVPHDLAAETRLDPDLASWLAFARQKLDEIVLLRRALHNTPTAVADALAENARALASRRTSPRVHADHVRRAVASITPAMDQRTQAFAQRQPLQRQRLNLPLLPTTTIGSFPQTAEIRAARAAHKRGELSDLNYLQRMREEIALAIRRQEELGLDVLVHGEAERNDMVEFFGEKLAGYAFTLNGWVQSYGSRCVKPPLIYGDVWRPEAMTVDAARHAQSLSTRPVKGMLTGPVTMLQWAFVRDDQPREQTALQIALALRQEVCELEKAGIAIIQIDEPAFREGLPLRRHAWPAYLDWAARAFRIAASGVRDDTQIHTHMCYSEFADILPAIAAMDADVITIETSRSRMALLDAFGEFAYPNEIGPGVYDIHSPRVPSVEDMLALLRRAATVIPVERLWVNPDCGLKTRGWAETMEALARMIEAARQLRQEHAQHHAEKTAA